ncbi:hypothetical protein [Nocardioides aurantiacus]|uniref:Uncharacterized protein n=1 Tax=Nocardioides aurantiacus TaxID=86796 RepID=A0A3N2CP81_9ACTN|nr:hypothetical protein [Nocardioides aurantiacus]ROR89337.1 hypothetical protein EDD33_0157 [Nocardioides aurantiacus]
MPTPEIFKFTTDNLSDYNEVRIAQTLRDHPAVYVNHLEIAAWIEGWTERLRERSDEGSNEDYIKALREVMAHLRQGDFVPNGPLLGDEY